MKKQQGFTLIELISVIVILGILSAVAFPKFQDLSGSAKTAVLQGCVASLKSAAVIQLAKNSGTAQSASTIISAANLDSSCSTSTSGCTITVSYSGGGGTSQSTGDLSAAGFCQ